MRWSRKGLLAAWLCALAVSVHSAAVNTENTLIVTKQETTGSTETLGTNEATTEGPLPPIKLTKMDVTSDISMRYAHTTIVTYVKNSAKRPQEAMFRVLLPETSFISGFEMTLDGKVYKAYVKEKEEAKKEYMEAVSHGISAAHVATKARDSNHFTVSVNVEASSTAIFNLTCEELLTRRNSVYNHVINLHPGTLVPNLTVTVHINETQKISELRVPEVRTGNEIDADENDPQNSKVDINRINDKEVTIVFNPDLEEQKRLMEVYAAKSKESQAQRNRFSYYEAPEEPKVENVLGQFVVQYDVERPPEGEILVNDGYFVHSFAPPSLPSLYKHVVFVLDTSGSMSGRKIEQLREAMQVILGELNLGDYFSIVQFADFVKIHDLRKIDLTATTTTTSARPYYYYEEYNPPIVPLPPTQATPENIAKAKSVVGDLDANGGTDINQALTVAIDLIQRGVGWTADSNLTSSSNSTESTTANSNATDSTITYISSSRDGKAIETATKQFEPMIIFLTDGEATSGVTDSRSIVNNVAEKNYGPRRASIFTLGLGEDADMKILRILSTKNDGFMRHIYEAADTVLQLRDFYRQLASPQLSHVKFVYPKNQVKDDTLTKSNFRTLYGGSEIIVAGRIIDDVTELTPEIIGYRGIIDEGFARIPYIIHPIARIQPKVSQDYWPLERLWSYLTIKQLLDEHEANQNADKKEDEENGPKKKAMDLALRYQFVTELTSLVVVKPNSTNAVDAESVDKVTPFGPGAPIPAYQQSNFLSLGPGIAPNAAISNVAYTDNRSELEALDIIYPIPDTQDSDERDFATVADELTNTELATTTTPVDTLTVYRLDSFSWVEPLIKTDTDELNLPVNGTDIHLKLSRDAEAPKSSAGDEDCPQATDGTIGSCVYLTRCDAARNITVDVYATTHCFINNEYAGVCCPKVNVQEEAAVP